MSDYFVDTSALAKRYVAETGSTWVRSWIHPDAGHRVFISAIASVEVMSALMRREREGTLSREDRQKLENDFLYHVETEYLLIDPDKNVLNKARYLLKHALRTLDAIQLASALETSLLFDIHPIFVSADTRLLNAAAAEGLPIDDPHAHP